jgi:hypothetical protein
VITFDSIEELNDIFPSVPLIEYCNYINDQNVKLATFQDLVAAIQDTLTQREDITHMLVSSKQLGINGFTTTQKQVDRLFRDKVKRYIVK